MVAYRAAAACSGVNPETAAEWLAKAAAIEAGGPEASAPGLGSKEDAVAAWQEMSGIDWSSPEGKDKVYKAAAEYRRREIEAIARRQKLAAAAKKKGPKTKKGRK